MKRNSIISLGILVATFICFSHFSSLKEVLQYKHKTTNEQIQNVEKRQINDFYKKKRKPVKRISIV